MNGLNPDKSVSVVIPALNEEVSLPKLLNFIIQECSPQPYEIIVSDSGSTDNTIKIVSTSYPSVIIVRDRATKPSRASTLNNGLAAARGEYVIFIHADTYPPADFVRHVRTTLSDGRISLSAFRTIVTDGTRVQRWITFHHYIKTWYAACLSHPILFIFYGLKSLFGDQCLFARRTQLLQVEGFDVVPVMEESSLCKKLVRLGPQRLLHATCTTSDRRIKLYGQLRVTLLHLFIGFGAELGVPLSWLRLLYPPQQVLEERKRTIYQLRNDSLNLPGS